MNARENFGMFLNRYSTAINASGRFVQVSWRAQMWTDWRESSRAKDCGSEPDEV